MISGALLDLGGVVYVGDAPLPGAVEAVHRLRAAGLPVRFVTNTTRQPPDGIRSKLAGMGLDVGPDDIFAPTTAARQRLTAAGLTPHALVHPEVEPVFDGLSGAAGTAVVIGDASRAFTYDRMNAAFRALLDADAFYALSRNRTFRDADGGLSLDAGPFVTALEHAAGREATVLGKPAAAFFHTAVESMGVAPDRAVMVGDDAESDVAGAVSAGLQGVLVRQGKYRAGDENAVAPAPGHVADDLPAAVAWILGER